MNTSRTLTLFLALALLALALLALSAPAARAADPVIVRVTTTGTRTWPCGDQTNWSNPCALQTALSNTVSGSELWVAAGTYTPTMGVTRTVTFQLRDGVALYGGFAGGETLRSQRNMTANVTLLSGDLNGNDSEDLSTYDVTRSDNAYHVVTAGGGTNTAVLDGVTVRGGNANVHDNTDPNSRGGGLYNDGGSPTVANVTFISNTAYSSAGGMYNASSNPTLTNVTFRSNSARRGGGMYNWGGSPSLTNVAFISNTAGDGGGMYNASSSPTVANVTFTANAATWGGGMYNYNGSSPRLMNVTFSDNYSTWGGGGLDNQYSTPTLTNVTFISNTAFYEGGAMENLGSNPTLTNVTFSGNSVEHGVGGGMSNNASSPTLTNVTFSGNSSNYAGGGGMYNAGSSSPTLTNVTFSGNSGALECAMLNNNSGPTIRNSLFWAYFWGYCAQIVNQNGSNPAVSDSVVQYGYPDGTNIITADPLLGPLGDYGVSTETVPLLPGSSAIDAGNNATCPSTDQRGVPRPQGARCDIGAYESRGFTLTKISGDNQTTPRNTAFASPLGVTVSSTHGEPVNDGRDYPSGIVSFTAPSSGASAIPMTSTVTITSGAALRTLTANGTAGSYAVTANTAGAAAPVTFSLTNSLYGPYLPLIQR